MFPFEGAAKRIFLAEESLDGKSMWISEQTLALLPPLPHAGVLSSARGGRVVDPSGSRA